VRLELADVSTTISGEVKDLFLGDLPNGLVDGFDIIGDTWDVLNRPIVCNDHILHLVISKTEIDELVEEPWANDLKFPCEDMICIAKEHIKTCFLC
jgi:hypothetical protein